MCFASLHRHNVCVEENHWVYVVCICSCGYWLYRCTLLVVVIFVSSLDEISVMLALLITGRMIAFTKHAFGRGFSKVFAVCCAV